MNMNKADHPQDVPPQVPIILSLRTIYVKEVFVWETFSHEDREKPYKSDHVDNPNRSSWSTYFI